MEFGKYFKLSSNSDFKSGVTTYYYLPVTRSEEDSSIPQYPIYLSITKTAINFYYHRSFSEKDNPEKKHHQNIRIIHLPLSANLAVKDNLTYILRSSFKEFIDIHQEFKQEIDKTSDHYFYDLKREENKTSSKNLNKIWKKRLILDFIYDWEHTKLFEHCKDYDEIEVKIIENSFFNALIAKMSYFYFRSKYQKSKHNKSDNEIYLKKLAESEKQWIDIIRPEDSHDLFWHSGGWFEDAETELRTILFSKGKFKRELWRAKYNKNSKINHEENIRILRAASQWFIRRYAIWSAFKTINSHNKFWDYYRWSFIISLVYTMFFVEFEHSDNDVIISRIILILLYSAILFIIYLFTNFSFLLPKFGLVMPRMIMALTSAWLMFVTTEELWKISFDIYLFEQIWVLFLLIPVIIFVSLEIFNLAPDISLQRIFSRSIFMILITMLCSVVIGTVLSHFTYYKILKRSSFLEENYFEHFSDYAPHGEDINTNSLFVHETGKRFIEKNEFISFFSKMKSSFLSDKKRCVDHSILIQINTVIGKIIVFPGMLFFRAIIALFIGIFVQLIFDDKPITEPL